MAGRKVVHWHIFTEEPCGANESVKDLVRAERKLGLDSTILDLERVPENAIHVIHTLFDIEFIKKYRGKKLFFLRTMPEHWLEGVYVNARRFWHVMNLLNYCDALVGFLYRQIDIYRFYTAKPIYKIPLGVDLDRYSMKGRIKELDGNPSILWCDTPYSVKYPFILFHALKYLYRKGFKGFKLHMIVPERYHKGIRAIFKMLDMDDRLELYDYLLTDELIQFYRGADLSVTTNMYGDVNRSIAERFACGLPTITFNSTRRWNIYFLCTYENHINLGETIKSVYENWLSEGLRVQCRNLAENEFDIDKTAKAMLNIYKMIEG